MDRSNDSSDGDATPPTARPLPDSSPVTARPVVVPVPLAALIVPAAEADVLEHPPLAVEIGGYHIEPGPQNPAGDNWSAAPAEVIAVNSDFTRQIADFIDAFAVLAAVAPGPSSAVSAAPPAPSPPPFRPLPSIAALAIPSLVPVPPALIPRPVAEPAVALPAETLSAVPVPDVVIAQPETPADLAQPLAPPLTPPPAPATPNEPSAFDVAAMGQSRPNAIVPPVPIPPLAPTLPQPLRADPVRRRAAPQKSQPAASRAWTFARKAVKFAGLAAAAYVGLVIVLLFAYRFFNPPMSSLMVQHRIAGEDIIHDWVPIDAISPQIVRAVLLSEDGRFCQHYGVDLIEMQAAIERAGDGYPRGASTISMQVIKNLFLWPSKSYIRKAIEIPLTYLMELIWPKRRIMEVYLNIAEWGPGIFGVGAASKFHFDKAAGRLNEREAAQLAVALPNPYSRDAGDPGPQTRRLAGDVQGRMRNAYPSQTACVLGTRTASR